MVETSLQRATNIFKQNFNNQTNSPTFNVNQKNKMLPEMYPDFQCWCIGFQPKKLPKVDCWAWGQSRGPIILEEFTDVALQQFVTVKRYTIRKRGTTKDSRNPSAMVWAFTLQQCQYQSTFLWCEYLHAFIETVEITLDALQFLAEFMDEKEREVFRSIRI